MAIVARPLASYCSSRFARDAAPVDRPFEGYFWDGLPLGGWSTSRGRPIILREEALPDPATVVRP